MAEKIISVSQLCEYIGSVLLTDPILKRLYVKGEVSNCTYHSNGNIYFTLKDDGAVIKCIVFYDVAESINVILQDGVSVSVKGHIIHNKKDGSYSIAVKEIEAEGTGKLFEETELLKQRLLKEGLFDIAHKKAIPVTVKSIGVVTSDTGAVIRDIINVSTRRNKNIEIVLSPAKVQGIGAQKEIINALNLLEEYGKTDVIIIARGGGSYEDLSVFNDETLARAIYDCKKPVISAIGHEVDFTICDFVSDLRAPTPSAAAELAVKDIRGVLDHIDDLDIKLLKNSFKLFEINKRSINALNSKLGYLKPLNVLSRENEKIEMLTEMLIKAQSKNLMQNINDVNLLSEKLSALSPLGVLQRGYAIIKDEVTNTLITSAKNVNNSVQVIMQDGIIFADVKKVDVNEGQ